MSVSYDFRECKNSAEHLQEHAYFICIHMMAIGMGEITEDNYKEVYARTIMLEASCLRDGVPWLKLESIKDLIGSKFNIAFESAAKFSTRIINNTIGEVERLEAKESKEVA